ncbi:phosphatase PAP2 family protein [Streptoalloteichus hindustanus]|uniref:PAP2 superfamily protein n=1 Tax=Streptoalloteichus hindustanus TaxID=2017 RepID=A0A1M5PNE8_STRHI|nr:phosphatase PAP2 family protein [Streptoalloteichus hindustanus]SHH03119.1 PAP2 superfamily protein [Streptoalloteichus hindustanus]
MEGPVDRAATEGGPPITGTTLSTRPVGPVDLLTLTYLAVVAGVAVLFRDRVDGWLPLLVGLTGYAAVLVGLAALARRRPHDRRLASLRLVCPLLALPFLYGAVERYVLVLHGEFLDARVNAWERALLGFQPNLVLDQLASPPLTELLMACYFSYYACFLVPPLVFLLRGRPDHLERYVFGLLLALYVCYLGFLVVPVLGPAHALRGEFTTPHLAGHFFVPVQDFLMAHGDPVGACFPSSHVAGAWTAVLLLRRWVPRAAFRWLAGIAVGLTVAVVHSRYHYLSDAVAGLLVAAACHRVATRIRFRNPFAPQSPEDSRKNDFAPSGETEPLVCVVAGASAESDPPNGADPAPRTRAARACARSDPRHRRGR